MEYSRTNSYKKNFGSINEGRGYASARKNKAVNKYKKMHKGTKFSLTEDKRNLPSFSERKNKAMQNVKMKKTSFQKAMEDFKRKEDEKKKQREENIRRQKERAEAMKNYKQKKKEKFKRLSKKTKKGQPVMKDRINYLLEKIQKQVQADVL